MTKYNKVKALITAIIQNLIDRVKPAIEAAETLEELTTINNTLGEEYKRIRENIINNYQLTEEETKRALDVLDNKWDIIISISADKRYKIKKGIN